MSFSVVYFAGRRSFLRCTTVRRTAAWPRWKDPALPLRGARPKRLLAAREPCVAAAGTLSGAGSVDRFPAKDGAGFRSEVAVRRCGGSPGGVRSGLAVRRAERKSFVRRRRRRKAYGFAAKGRYRGEEWTVESWKELRLGVVSLLLGAVPISPEFCGDNASVEIVHGVLLEDRDSDRRVRQVRAAC